MEESAEIVPRVLYKRPPCAFSEAAPELGAPGLDSETGESTIPGHPLDRVSVEAAPELGPPGLDSETGESTIPGRLLPRAFFEAPPGQVAPLLLGKLLVHRTEDENGTKYLAGRIVEAEAYLGPHNDPPDPAAHAHRGPTPRNQVLFGRAGHAYVYAIYGRYFCMNIGCEAEGLAGCVLLRALEPVLGADQMARNRGLAPGAPARELTSGPSRLCQALGLTRLKHNFLDLTAPASVLQVRDDGCAVEDVLITPRIGIHEAVDWPLRFAIPGHPCVSGPKRLRLAAEGTGGAV